MKPVRILVALVGGFYFVGCMTSPESPVSPETTPESYGNVGAGEGPAWHPKLGLLYSGGGKINRRDPEGGFHVFRNPSGGSNGLLFDREGRLLTCEAGRRRVTRTEPDGTITVLADNYQGMKFNTPNDLAIDARGRIYFSDPRYGNRDSMEIKDAEGKRVEGVYRIDAPGRVTRIITHEVDRPNGLVVSPDNQHLYVADNNNNNVGGARKLFRFDLNPDGSIDPDSRLLVHDWKSGRGPDGMAMDVNHRLYVAAGRTKPRLPAETVEEATLGGVYIFSPDHKLIGFVPIPVDEVTNCAFGDEDGRSLFVTAGGTLWRLRTDVAGHRFE